MTLYFGSSTNNKIKFLFDAKLTLTAAEGEPEGDHGGAAMEEDEGLQEGRGHLWKLSDCRDEERKRQDQLYRVHLFL